MRECVLCGKLAILTSDHIPPRGMFPAGTSLITVPVCQSCNNSASKEDEYFRAAIALRIEVEANPVVNELLPQITRGLLRSGVRGNTGSIVSTVQDIDLFTRAGVYVGKGGTYAPDELRLSRVAARIVRGLYWREFGGRLPDGYGVAVHIAANLRLQPTEAERFRYLAGFALSGKGVQIHPDVFSYSFRSVPDSEPMSVWVMTFYRHTPMLCLITERATFHGDRPLL